MTYIDHSGTPERLWPGPYVMTYWSTPARPGSVEFRLQAERDSGVWWHVVAVADPDLRDLVADHHVTRLEAAMVDATVGIVRGLIANERLPRSTSVDITFTESHAAVARVVQSDRLLALPRHGEEVLRYDLTEAVAPADGQRQRGQGNRRKGRNSRRKGRR